MISRHHDFPGDRAEDYATTWRACYGWLIIGDYAAALLSWLGKAPVSDQTRERWFRLGAAVDYLDDVLDEGPADQGEARLERFKRLLDVTLATGEIEELELDACVSLVNLRRSYEELPPENWHLLLHSARFIGLLARYKRLATRPRDLVALLESEAFLTSQLFVSSLTARERVAVGPAFARALSQLTRAGVFYDHARDLMADVAGGEVNEKLGTRLVEWRLYARCARHLIALASRPGVALCLTKLALNRGVLRGLLGRDKLVGLDGIALAMLDEQEKAWSGSDVTRDE